jgi:DNA-binding response OmpR family regulator
LIVNVDNNEVARSRRTRMLTQKGYRVVEATTAAEAREHCAANEAELTFLDVQLPDGNGFDVCRRLKGDRPFVPIIMISSIEQTMGARLDALAAAADAYLIEPVPPKQLLEVVRGFLGHISDAVSHDSGWVITDPAGLIEMASDGMERVFNRTVHNLNGRRLTDYFEDREAAGSLLRAGVSGHGGLRSVLVRPRERAPLSSIVQTSTVTVRGDSLLHVRWAFTTEGRWRRAGGSADHDGSSSERTPK